MTGLRTAFRADVPRIAELMRTSVLEIFPAFYSVAQTRSASVHIARLDLDLIDDRTYYVHEARGAIVACGGWSRRAKLYAGPAATDGDDRLLAPGVEPARVRAMFVRSDQTRRGLGRAILDAAAQAAAAEGFTDLALLATLPGVPLYRACGFVETKRVSVTLPDGVALDGVEMSQSLSSRTSSWTTRRPDGAGS